MSDVVIRLDGLGKKFAINSRQEGYKTLRESLASAATRPFRGLKSSVKNAPHQRHANETLWALKDVSFEVKQGEVVGLIGRNGAGKSTLLKILSRVTEPTNGRAQIVGRVGSLLEVGVGFHPELSGRENISLNGAILGMKRLEIERNFDAIVEFAELEKFIDTPVKHYSSGMYLRLAFAVAAHLEPEILLIDEVLAVGDAAFQKKCIGKMEEVAGEGRTVLFVSHNMAAVQALCKRGIFLHNGTVQTDASASGAIASYLRMMEHTEALNLLDRVDRRGKGDVKLSKVEIFTDSDDHSTILATGRPASFVFHTTSLQPGMSCVFTIYDTFGQALATFNSSVHSPEDSNDPAMGERLICHLDELSLTPGRYRINVALVSDGDLQDHIEGASFFEVEQGVINGRPIIKGNGLGRVCMHHRWITPQD